MNPADMLSAMHVAERLKDTMRHSYTPEGRRESVAEHTFRVALMAMFMRDEFPDLDMDRVIRMCLIHDLGECFTGDIPTFLKTAGDEAEEERLLYNWVASLPAPYDRELREMYEEMAERKTPEAKLYKALDGLEAVIQHNEADISTWEPHEYELNLNYCVDRCAFSPYLSALRALVREETVRKIEESESNTKL